MICTEDHESIQLNGLLTWARGEEWSTKTLLLITWNKPKGFGSCWGATYLMTGIYWFPSVQGRTSSSDKHQNLTNTTETIHWSDSLDPMLQQQTFRLLQHYLQCLHLVRDPAGSVGHMFGGVFAKEKCERRSATFDRSTAHLIALQSLALQKTLQKLHSPFGNQEVRLIFSSGMTSSHRHSFNAVQESILFLTKATKEVNPFQRQFQIQNFSLLWFLPDLYRISLALFVTQYRPHITELRKNNRIKKAVKVCATDWPKHWKRACKSFNSS